MRPVCNKNKKACSKKGVKGCFNDFTAKASCSSDTSTNNCNFFLNVSNKPGRGDCRQAANSNPSESSGFHEFYGGHSRCFTGNVNGAEYVHENMCFKAACVKGVIKITVGDKVLDCRTTGQKVEIRHEEGQDPEFITCPDVKKFCAQEALACPNDCNLQGRCLVGNKCFCYTGFSGDDCSHQNKGHLAAKNEHKRI